MTSRRQSALLVAALLLAACSSDDAADPTTTDATTTDATPPVVVIDRNGGNRAGSTAPAQRIGLQLGEGQAEVVTADPIPVVDGTPLPADDVTAILDRLPDWLVPDDDARDFARPADTIGPPRVGATIDTEFPPPPDPGRPTVTAGPLHVVRFQPEGDVDVAPFLSVTFDAPMVPITTVDQLAAADVPVVIEPAVDGRWRWIGTRTLRFEVLPGETDRLPAATAYTVTVPAGTESATGGVLESDVTWTFSTPAPAVTTVANATRATDESGDRLGLTPVFVAVFDQRVDPAAVLATTTLSAGQSPVALRLATDAEIASDAAAAATTAATLDDRWVAFRAVDPLPTGTSLTIEIGPGTPSAEGPLTSGDASRWSARTYGPFDIELASCAGSSGCEPGMPITIAMTNAIDTAGFDASMVAVEPAIPGLRLELYGASIMLEGATAGRTTYTVTLAPELADVFGQTLGEQRTASVSFGPARPQLRVFDQTWITTDPMAATPSISAWTVNHDVLRVTAWAVSADDLLAFRAYLEDRWSDTAATPPDWPVVLDAEITVDGADDRFVETPIDLTDAFARSGSQLVVQVEPVPAYQADQDDYWTNQPSIAWVQSTTLGVDAIVDADELLVWATDLTTGAPVGDVTVELVGDGRTVTTDAGGIARIDLGQSSVHGLSAVQGDRSAVVPSHEYSSWARQIDSDGARWYVFDDLGIHRPGDTARLTGWVRRLSTSSDGRLTLFGGASVVYTAYDAQGNELGSGTTELNALNGFNLAIDIPEGANLGPAWVQLHLTGGDALPDGASSTTYEFRIDEFRTPEFEVIARNESSGPHYVAQPTTVAVEAAYYAGGGLPDADVTWLVSSRETTYEPAGWDAFTFGIWHPWWSYGAESASRGFDVDCFDCGPWGTETTYEEFQGRTDASGTHYLSIDVGDTHDDGSPIDLPTSVTAEATVFDVNRQAWAARTDLLVHAAELYVGLRSDRTFVESGSPFRIDTIVTDVDGNAVEGRTVELTAGRVESAYVDGVWTEEVVDTTTCTVTSASAPVRCELATGIGGTYRVTAVVVDEAGNRNRTELTQWVSGGTTAPSRTVEQQSVTIVPSQETYAPGETAELLVQAPFAPAHGLLTITRNGIVSSQPFVADSGSTVLEIPITDDHVPNLGVQIEMVGTAPRANDDGSGAAEGTPAAPAFAIGSIDLRIPPVTRALGVEATPSSAEVEPGSETSVTVTVTGPDGEPVAGADVAIVVADEAVLGLTGYELDDPLDVFYADVATYLTTRYSRSSIMLERADQTATTGADDTAEDSAGGAVAEESMSYEADGDVGAAQLDGAAPPASPDARATTDGEPIEVRDDFDALALYAPSETSGADGTVTVAVSLPDNLTRYRIMAVAVDGTEHFGSGEATLTARRPLMVRPSAPRILNFGDRFELPVVVQNQTDAPLDVDVVVEAANLDLDGTGGTRVTVPANDRIEVRFPLSTDQAGVARLRVAAVSGDFDDAAELEIPVYTPATAEAFATYGVIDSGAIAQPVVAPTAVLPEFGGLEVDTSSTALQSLTDALIYLSDYRYESSDAYASRLMAIASLREVLEAFDADGLPEPDELDAQVARDIERLAALQNDDGGWPYWQRGRESVPWQSIQSVHALVLARDAGYRVPAASIDRGLQHLAAIESFIDPDYGEAIRDMLSAYALSVRHVAGDTDSTKALDLYRRAADELEVDALAWLWPSISDPAARAEIERTMTNRAVETAGAVTFATSYGEDAYVVAHSDRRTDGIVLDALITESPGSDLIPKAVAGLMANQVRGRWNNVQENGFILVALHRYFDTFEDVTPDFVARAWLGETYLSEHEFRGRETDRVKTVVPMDELMGSGETDVVLQQEGTGRLYYRLGVRYAPSDLTLDARDEGFVVDRVYEAVDDPADVTRDADGTWRIRAGATVRVRLTMVADATRTNMALIDPLPAGLETLNPSLAVTQTIAPEDDIAGPDESIPMWCSCWQWFEHQNMRDDRVEAFSSYLPGGTYEYAYTARATTPGEFVVPPARAEEIYAPEVFGRTATDSVVVE